MDAMIAIMEAKRKASEAVVRQAKKELTLIDIKNKTLNPIGVAGQIVSYLKENRIYAPNYLYRGLNVPLARIETIRKYGTDRTPGEQADAIAHLIEQREEFAQELDDDNEALYSGEISEKDIESLREFQKDVLRETDPNFIWAAPQQFLSKCVEDYALGGENIPLVLVYRPQGLIYSGDGIGSVGHGVNASKLNLKNIKHVSECKFRFKSGISPLETALAGFRILK